MIKLFPGAPSIEVGIGEEFGKWLARVDDFRTFLAEFVSKVPQSGFQSQIGWQSFARHLAFSPSLRKSSLECESSEGGGCYRPSTMSKTTLQALEGRDVKV